jgi:hypothetical protein
MAKKKGGWLIQSPFSQRFNLEAAASATADQK